MKIFSKVKLVLIVVGLGFHFQNIAQIPRVKNYTLDHGLTSNEVYHVLQDSKGYMWFCTDRGVSRFNGYEFEAFTKSDGLPNNTVFYAQEDSNY